MRLLSLLAAVLALGLAGITTSAAAGAAAPHARSLTSLTAARPARHLDRGIGKKAAAIYNSCSIGNGHFTEYGNNCGHPVKYSCQVGTVARFSYSPSYVSNGCPTRVIIYTGATLNGHRLCIGPHTATNRLRRTYRSFRIGSSPFC
jgi:hypothetical protein